MKKILSVLFALVFMASVISVSVGAVAEGAYVNIGDYGSEVVALHQKLTDLGYFSLRPESPWSAMSEAAVRAVQYVTDMPETGVVENREVYDMLMNLDSSVLPFSIKKISAIDEYLEFVRDEGLTVIIAVRDEAAGKLQNSTKEQLKELGLQTDWNDRYRKAYIAVIEGTTVVEEIAAAEKTGAGLTTSGTASAE